MTLTCKSESTTVPSTHSLSFTYTWDIQDEVNPRYYIYSPDRSTMIITNVSIKDSGKVFACRAKEDVEKGYTSEETVAPTLNVHCKFWRTFK